MGLGLLTNALLAAAVALLPPSAPGDRLYGRVETVRGDVHVGFIRWGRNAGGWADVLVGNKGISEENQRQARRLKAEAEPQGDRAARSIVYNGVLISWDDDDSEIVPDTAQSGVRFGQVRSVTRTDHRIGRVVLRSGLQVDLTSPGERLPFVDTLVIEPASGDDVKIPWDEVTGVTFESAPAESTARAERLHGTVKLQGGDTYVGYLGFDGGRIYTTDSLRGRTGDETRRIAYGDVQTIVWEGSTARVTLASGETVRLEGARSGNTFRISDPTLGGVTFSLNRVEEIRFHPPDAATTYESFAVPHRLRATAVTTEGARYHGFIRWDNDEESSWEILNGSEGGLTFTIELGKVKSVAMTPRRRSRVTLLDGREFELSGSNDVGPGNKGLVIEMDDGSMRFVDWVDLATLELENP
jgi:hypothetical protein